MLKKTSEVVQAAGLGPLIVSIFTKLGVLVPPWLMLGFLFGFSALSHALWGSSPAVSWAAMAGTFATVILSGLTWLVSHARGPIGRIHSTLSTACGCLWFTIATITGVTAKGTFFFWFFGGVTLALGWNIRAVIRTGHHGQDGGRGHGDALKELFDRSKENFGLKGAEVKTKEVTEHKIKAVLELPPGEKTAGDVVKRTEYIESGMHLPPGSVSVNGDENDAARAHFTITDPRVMKKPIAWPGPSAPGESIALPLRLGIYQDSEIVWHPILGHHTQIMGTTGSGKSIGGCWNYLGETISRKDVAVFAIDTSKGEQTLGPLKPGLHRLETTKAGAVKFLRALHAEIPKRTQWLTEHGYTKWVEGCGLLYWVIHIEEAAKFWGNLSSKDEDLALEVMKELRSAGGSINNSLQRSTHTEMPTLARGQHKAFMCFGVAKEEDAEYGLSDAQQDAEARPHLFKQPGMAYLDHPHQDGTHLGMPLRTWDWALGCPEGAPESVRDQAAVQTMTDYAVQYPAQAKPMDEFTARLAAFPASQHAPALPVTGRPEALPTPAAHDLDVVNVEPEDDGDDLGELLAQAAELIITTQHASSAMLSRKLRLPHAAAVQLLEALEMKGVVGPQPAEATEPREVLVDAEDAETVIEGLREDGHPIAEYLRTDDPDPEVVAGPYDEIREPTLAEDTFNTLTSEQAAERKAAKLPPEQARALVYAWIHQRSQTKPVFNASDSELKEVRTRAGMTSRGWIYKVLSDLVARGVLAEDKDGPTALYTIVDLEPLNEVLTPA
ncbi:DNA translocase FtsK [Actinocorallia libanotica]|uniref:FtsK gamma domain-containing protein n=1 Tax=Actinocorallia libanotica TaxID=46162 RepID=A0ABN1S003_9ACTN